MMLGSDVSSLTTTAANAAAQGLSIVVPVYNEAAGLSRMRSQTPKAFSPATRRLSCCSFKPCMPARLPEPEYDHHDLRDQ